MAENQFQRDPDYWWLRLRYAQRENDARGEAEARRRLSELGVKVQFTESQREGSK